MTAQELRTRLADQPWFNRFLEIVPGAAAWLVLVGPIVMSRFQPIWVAYFIIGFDLLWLTKSFRLSYYLIRGYRKLHAAIRINWRSRLDDLGNLDNAISTTKGQILALVRDYPGASRPLHFSSRQRIARNKYINMQKYLRTLEEVKEHSQSVNPEELYHAIILATYNESVQTLEPSLKAIAAADYDMSKVIFILAYEQRGGAEMAKNAKELVQKYGGHFKYAVAVEHPDGIAGEVRGKGANITYAGRKLAQYVSEQGIEPSNVIVTTLDSDHRPDAKYFAYLAFSYATNPNRVRRSFQPVPMFYNNIWDAPAPMRIIAHGNSFWILMEGVRPKRLRNFAAHAQSLQALIDTDFWSTTTIVEDGHQYWRSYFAYEGDHQVVPLYIPIYQDAVLAKGYWRTFRAQFLQLRRWAWGVTDFPYVVRESMKHHRIPLGKRLHNLYQLFEGHLSWSTAPLILSFTAWLPLFLNQDFKDQVLAHQLPVIASRLLSVTLVGMLVTVYISLISLPPRPARYKPHRFVNMILQWALLPLTAIGFASFAALNAQTRLMFGKYLEFYVTEKEVKSD